MTEAQTEHIKDFLRDLEELLRGYNIGITHQDYQGGFILTELTEENLTAIKDAEVQLWK